MQNVFNSRHRFKYHTHHGDNNPYHNKGIKKPMQTATVFTWKNQGMHFLTEGTTFICDNELLISGD